MRKLKSYLFVALFFVFSTVYGLTAPCPGEFGISAEWLYMLPAHSHPYFATPLPEVSEVERPANRQDWTSGYRVELIYSFCDCLNDMRIRWTHFPSFSAKRQLVVPNFPQGPEILLSSPFVAPEFGNVELFSAMLRDAFNFHYLDALVGWNAINCSAFVLMLQGGLQYSQLKLKEHGVALGRGFRETVEVKSSLWGIGPEIGVDFSRCFCTCFNLTARAYSSLLVSKRESSTSFLLDFGGGGPIDTTLKNEDYWLVVPTATTRFGISYTYLLNCFDNCLGPLNLDIEVGYEATWMFNGISRIITYTTTDEATPPVFADQLSTFSIHGPYLHIGISF